MTLNLRAIGLFALVGLLIVLTGFLAPAMFIVGGIFALLWGVAIRLGRQVDQARASGSDDASDASAG